MFNSKDQRRIVVAFIGGLIISVIVAWWLSSYSCRARWERSGMESEFRMFVGCLVKRTNNGWIPDRFIREVQP